MPYQAGQQRDIPSGSTALALACLHGVLHGIAQHRAQIHGSTGQVRRNLGVAIEPDPPVSGLFPVIF